MIHAHNRTNTRTKPPALFVKFSINMESIKETLSRKEGIANDLTPIRIISAYSRINVTESEINSYRIDTKSVVEGFELKGNYYTDVYDKESNIVSTNVLTRDNSGEFFNVKIVSRLKFNEDDDEDEFYSWVTDVYSIKESEEDPPTERIRFPKETVDRLPIFIRSWEKIVTDFTNTYELSNYLGRRITDDLVKNIIFISDEDRLELEKGNQISIDIHKYRAIWISKDCHRRSKLIFKNNNDKEELQ
jgi:hypothetical protein